MFVSVSVTENSEPTRSRSTNTNLDAILAVNGGNHWNDRNDWNVLLDLDGLNYLNELRPRALSRREQLLDLRGYPSILRLHSALERGDRLALLIQKILVKIPARRFSGL
jgi:hypothetical protein